MKNFFTKSLIVMVIGMVFFSSELYPIQAQLESLKVSCLVLRDKTIALRDSLVGLQSALNGQDGTGVSNEKILALQKHEQERLKNKLLGLRITDQAAGMRAMMQQEFEHMPGMVKDGLLKQYDAVPMYTPLNDLVKSEQDQVIGLGQILYVGGGLAYLLEPLSSLYSEQFAQTVSVVDDKTAEDNFNQETVGFKGAKTLTDKAFDAQAECFNDFLKLLSACKDVKIGNPAEGEYAVLNQDHALIKHYDLFLDEIEFSCNDFMTNVDKRYSTMQTAAFAEKDSTWQKSGGNAALIKKLAYPYDATGPVCADEAFQKDYAVHFDDIDQISYSPQNLAIMNAVVKQYGDSLLNWQSGGYYLTNYNYQSFLKDATGFNYLTLACTWCKEHFDKGMVLPIELVQTMNKLYELAKKLLSDSVKQMNINEHKQWAALRQLVEFFKGCITYNIKTNKEILGDLLSNMAWRTQGLVLAYILLSEGFADDDFLWWATGAVLFYRGQGAYSVGGHRQKRGADFACYQLLQIIKNGMGRTFGTVQGMCDNYVNYNGDELVARLGLSATHASSGDLGPVGEREFASLDNKKFTIVFMGAIKCFGGNGYTLFGARAKADILGMLRAQKLLALVREYRYVWSKKKHEDAVVLELAGKLKAEQKKLQQALALAGIASNQANAVLMSMHGQLEPAALAKLRTTQQAMLDQQAALSELIDQNNQALLDLNVNILPKQNVLVMLEKSKLAQQDCLQQKAELQQVVVGTQALLAIKIEQDLQAKRQAEADELQRQLKAAVDEQERLALEQQIRLQQEAAQQAELAKKQAEAQEQELLKLQEQKQKKEQATQEKERQEQLARDAAEKEKQDAQARKLVAGTITVTKMDSWWVAEFEKIAAIASDKDIIMVAGTSGAGLKGIPILEYFTYLCTNVSGDQDYKKLLSLATIIVKNMLASQKTLERLRTNWISSQEMKQFAVFCVFLATCPDHYFDDQAHRFTWGDINKVLSSNLVKANGVDMFKLYIMLAGGAREEILALALMMFLPVLNDVGIMMGTKIAYRDACLTVLDQWLSRSGYYSQNDKQNLGQFCDAITNPEKGLQGILKIIKDKLQG